MNFKNYYFLAIKSLYGKKSSILNIFFMVLSMFIMVFVLSFAKTYNNLITNQVNNNINNHILIINEEIDKNKIKDIQNIKYITNYTSYKHSVKLNDNNNINLIGIEDDYLKIENGKNLKDTLEKQVMICPTLFYLNVEDNYEEIDNFKNGNDLINKEFTIKSTDYNETYTIIGTYDANKYTYGEYNICFTRESNVSLIYEREIESIKKQCEQENRKCNIYSNSTMLIVEDVTKINETKQELENRNYNVSKLIEIDTTMINTITTIFLIISIIIMIINFIILLIANNKFIKYNKKNNLIYKTLGYSDSILVKVGYLENIIITILSFILTTIIVIVTYIIIYNILYLDIKTGLEIKISYISFILSFIFSLFTSLLSQYLLVKNNGSIIEELNDNEI